MTLRCCVCCPRFVGLLGTIGVLFGVATHGQLINSTTGLGMSGTLGASFYLACVAVLLSAMTSFSLRRAHGRAMEVTATAVPMQQEQPSVDEHTVINPLMQVPELSTGGDASGEHTLPGAVASVQA